MTGRAFTQVCADQDTSSSFAHHRFTWQVMDYDMRDFVRPNRPRRILSRKFAILLPHLKREVALNREKSVYWRASLSFCSEAEDHRHLKIHCSHAAGLDVLCLVRVFVKGRGLLAGTFYSLHRASKESPISYRLDHRTLKELEKKRRRSSVQIEILLVMVGQSGGASLLGQVEAAVTAGRRRRPPEFTAAAQRHFQLLLRPDAGNFSDVTLIVGAAPEEVEEASEAPEGGEGSQPVADDGGVRRFYVHRYMLTKESPVFEAMFTRADGFLENTKNEVSIPDVEGGVMEEFLHYVYTGTLPSSGALKGLQALIAVAEKYQVSSLKGVCELRLLSFLSHEEVRPALCVELLVFAHAYNLLRLRAVLLQLVAWQADTLLFHSEEGGEADVRLIAAYPDLHLELTKLLSTYAHFECPELEMDDSMSEGNSSGVSSNLSTQSDSSDSP